MTLETVCFCIEAQHLYLVPIVVERFVLRHQVVLETLALARENLYDFFREWELHRLFLGCDPEEGLAVVLVPLPLVVDQALLTILAYSTKLLTYFHEVVCSG